MSSWELVIIDPKSQQKILAQFLFHLFSFEAKQKIMDASCWRLQDTFQEFQLQHEIWDQQKTEEVFDWS